ncbi:TolB family protein [Nonomuraea candida]|uniref:TolB family protein n=1 Tax=Nonomuraea candida TaxID=359159 RepID=UPI0005B8D7C1|nr:hypothetical protein [Nonomuraea candida]
MITNLGAVLALTAVLGAPPAQPDAGTKLPGTDARFGVDMTGRPVQLGSYSVFTNGRPPQQNWAWSPAKRKFVKAEGPVTVSPGGQWQAELRQRRGPAEPVTVRFTDRKSGRETDVELPVPPDPRNGDMPLHTLWPTWSPDGSRLLLNVFASGNEPRSAGVVLVEVPALEARFVRIEKALITVGGFQWTRDGDGLVVRWGKNGKSSIRQYDLTGAVKRTWHVRGRPVPHGLGTFSPSGRRFVTACTSLEKSACVWDTATGKAVTRIKIAFSPVWGPVLGWYDEKHLLAPVRDGIGVVDLKGRAVETLVKVGKKQHLYPWFDARAKS